MTRGIALVGLIAIHRSNETSSVGKGQTMAVTVPPKRRYRPPRRALGACIALSLVAASCGAESDPLESTASEVNIAETGSTTTTATSSTVVAADAKSPALPVPPTVTGDAAGDNRPEAATAADPDAAAPAAASEAAAAPAPAAEPAQPAPAPAPTQAPTTAITAAPVPSSTAAPAPTTAAPPANAFPSVEVINIANGNPVNIASQLAGDGRPVLLWFWSPF